MDNRRLGDRRGEDRREFRQQEGRRDPERDPRNLRRRQILALVLPVLLLGAAAAAHQVWVVQPNQRAQVILESSRASIAPVLARTRLPMLALPGTGGPEAGDPSVVAISLLPGDRSQLERTETELDELWSTVPRSAALASQLGLIRLVLGRDRDARRAWESALVYGNSDERTGARLGLALVALRVGLRQENEQDRLFALEHGLTHLQRLSDVRSPEVLFNQGVLLAALQRADEARSVVSELRSQASPPLLIELLELWIEGPPVASTAEIEGGSPSADSLPEARSLPTIDLPADPSREMDSIGSTQ